MNRYHIEKMKSQLLKLFIVDDVEGLWEVTTVKGLASFLMSKGHSEISAYEFLLDLAMNKWCK